MKPKDREAELERLIREQQRDAGLDAFQPREKHVSFSFDQLGDGDGAGYEPALQTDYGTFRMSANSRHYDGCPIHGRGEVRIRPGTGELYCQGCARERERALRRRKGIPKRKWCEHDPELRFLNSAGKERCKQCLRDANKRRYWKMKAMGIDPNYRPERHPRTKKTGKL